MTLAVAVGERCWRVRFTEQCHRRVGDGPLLWLTECWENAAVGEERRPCARDGDKERENDTAPKIKGCVFRLCQRAARSKAQHENLCLSLGELPVHVLGILCTSICRPRGRRTDCRMVGTCLASPAFGVHHLHAAGAVATARAPCSALLSTMPCPLLHKHCFHNIFERNPTR